MRDRYYDNSRLSTAKRCLRKYYFRHVVDWEIDSFNKDLVFGSAWHSAMDTLWPIMASSECQNLISKDKPWKEDVANASFDAFLTTWLAEGGPDPKDLDIEEMKRLEPKTPMIALEMLYEYVEARRAFFADPTFKLLEVEKPFAVPLDPNDETLFYVGRIDKIFEKKGLVYAGEHKTSSLYSVHSGFRSTFLDSFSPNSQIDGYLHALHMLYGDKATGVWVDAALCHKKVHDVFQFIPIDRKHEQLDAWLYDTHWWVDTIEESWGRVERIDRDGTNVPYMDAFPKNTEACMDYGRSCPYIGPCKMIPNPVGIDIPMGYKEDRWSPFNRLELDKIGMKEE